MNNNLKSKNHKKAVFKTFEILSWWEWSARLVHPVLGSLLAY